MVELNHRKPASKASHQIRWMGHLPQMGHVGLALSGGVEPPQPPFAGEVPDPQARAWHDWKDLNPRRTVLETGMLPLHYSHMG